MLSALRSKAALVIGTVGCVVLAATGCSTPSSPPNAAAPPSPGSSSGTPAAPAGARPTVVLVHGAWADASSWDGVVEALTKQGYDVRAIANPLENLTSDAASVATFLRSLTGPIVLVGHSYGGSVITEAAANLPQVKALVYVDAAAPDVGETNGSLSGADSVLKQKPASELFDSLPDPGGPADPTDLYLKKDIFVQHFGNDLPADTRGPAVGHSARRLHRRVRHARHPGRLEDDPVLVLHQQRRPDHHSHLGTCHGRASTLDRHHL